MKHNADIAKEENSEVVLLLGGNLGDVERTFKKALVKIAEFSIIKKLSSIYKTDAWGMEEAPDFLNQAVVLDTTLTPQQLLNNILEIERAMGRERNSDGYQNRKLDIDIIFYGDLIVDEENLVVPHPKMQERNFVLVPLNEIIPEKSHPIFSQTVSQLYSNSLDTLTVHKV